MYTHTFFKTLLIALLVSPSFLFSQEVADSIIAKRQLFTDKIAGDSPIIDGHINDAAWAQVEWTGDFIQKEPKPLIAPTQETQMKVLYDVDNLFLAFRCFDDEPELIEKRMSRRDGFPGDWVEVNIDSYHDLRSAFSFTISVSGVKGDEFISNDGNNWDTSWNPIWYAKTNIDSLGWTAEMRIPLSQLRFSSAGDQIWGIQSTRRIFRAEERDLLQPVKVNDAAWVSRFAELHGLKNLQPQKQLEIQPYVLSQVNFYQKEEKNPFETGRDWRTSVGLDAKIGITNDLTLDLTINPDFGQVDADPGAVTLDGFQIFFQERRPFFVENRNIFDYRLTGSEAGGSYDRDLLFYSRRIGGQPHHRVYSDADDNYFVSQPENTTILGAAKFSGKTRTGLSIGILESITQEEVATIDQLGDHSEQVVEPFTNFFVGRVQQDFNEGNTVVGGILTSVQRDINDPKLTFLHQSALSGGLDVNHTWKNKEWVFKAKTLFSQVKGKEEAIVKTQTAFEHLFQRTDAEHLEVDSTLTSLVGTGGTLSIGNFVGKWVFESGLTWRSPQLELNDIGFLNNADEINYYFWGARKWAQPKKILRNFRWNFNSWARWDFSGTNLYQAVNTNAHAVFNNNWRTGLGINYELRDINNNALRGGPAIRRPNGASLFFYMGTDNRKRFSIGLNSFQGQASEKVVRTQGYGISFNWQPTDAMNLSVSPGYSRFQRKEQYVNQAEFNGETVYLNGRVDQETFNATLRLNYNITPDLTVQYYGEPFVSKGKYDRFNKITDNPLGKDFDDRFRIFSDGVVVYDEASDTYQVDESLDSTIDYTFGNPDFNFIQFRSNLVVRWEYIPGSELFFVWSQGAGAAGDSNQGLFRSLSDNIFGQQNTRNIFLVKGTYRFVR